MRSMDKIRNSRGFTLVEVSIILMVVVVLSAAIAPVLSSVVANARLTTARAEMIVIGRALQQFIEDIGCVFVPQNEAYQSTSSSVGAKRTSGRSRSAASNVVIAPASTPPALPPGGGRLEGGFVDTKALGTGCGNPDLCYGDAVEILVTAGDIPALGREGGERWAEPVDGTWVDFFEYYLISNTPGNDPGRAFASLAECGDPVANTLSQLHAWGGAYLNIGHGDPWGNRYAANVYFLSQTDGIDVVVLSAGPDQEIDSRFEMDGFVPGDDDIAVLFSTGPDSVPGR